MPAGLALGLGLGERGSSKHSHSAAPVGALTKPLSVVALCRGEESEEGTAAMAEAAAAAAAATIDPLPPLPLLLALLLVAVGKLLPCTLP